MMMAGFLSEKNNDDFEDYPTNLEYSSDDTEYYADEDYYTDEYDTGEYLDTNSWTNESGSWNMTITE